MTATLRRDTTQLLMGQGLRLLIQAAYFILVARALGPDQYGAFVTATALAAALGPFSGLGTQNLFVKNMRAGLREARVCWGNGLLLCLLSGLALSGAAAAIARLLHLRVEMMVIAGVAISDLVLLKITELAAFGFSAIGRMGHTSLQFVVINALRLGGIVALTFAPIAAPLAAPMGSARQVTLEPWVAVYCLTSLLGAMYALVRGTQSWGRPRLDLAALRADAAEGIFFSIAGSAATIYNDIDKIMLSQVGNLEATGLYAAAYRVIDVSMTPIRSLAAAAYPQFFRHGVNGMAATWPFALSLIAKAWVYGAAISAGLWLCAPALPILLGPQYQSATAAVRWLALIPLLRCLHSFMADALSGAGLQRTRTAIQVGVALANIVANLALLPRFSWRGAAWTSLGCDGLLVLSFWGACWYHNRPWTVAYADKIEDA